MANTTQTTLPSEPMPSDEHGLNTWLLWIVLLVVGLGMVVGLGHQSKSTQNALAKTEAAAARFQGGISALSADTMLAAYGDVIALERLPQIRNQVRSDLTLLQRGGYLSPSDTVAVLALAGRPEIPLSAANTQLDTFDRAAQAVLGSTDVLKQTAVAETQVASMVQRLAQASTQIGQANALSSGAWGNALTPLRQDLTRRDLGSLVLVLSAPENAAAARQWIALLAQRSKEAATLADLAAKDQNLSARDRELVGQLASATKTLSQNAEVLVKNADLKSQARAAVPQIQESSKQLYTTTTQMWDAIRTLDQNMWMTYALWAGLLCTLVGVAGVVRTLWNTGYLYWHARHDNQKGQLLAASVERVTRDLRKIVSLETSAERVGESPQSPIFPLCSMINKTLEQRAGGTRIVEEQGLLLTRIVDEMENVYTQIQVGQNEQKESVGSVHLNTMHFSQQLEQVHQSMEYIHDHLKRSLESARRGAAVAQDNVWRMDSMRENTQSVSKRIKRLGESAQNIGASTDVIKDISRRVKVLAINVAVEAASNGEQGKVFAALAQELERLTVNAEGALKDIDGQIGIIQNDAKDTVASMESSTTDVVECAKLSAETGNTFKDLDQRLEGVGGQWQNLADNMAQAAVGVQKESLHTQALSQSITQNNEQLRSLHNKAEAVRSVLSSLRLWLNGMGKDLG